MPAAARGSTAAAAAASDDDDEDLFAVGNTKQPQKHSTGLLAAATTDCPAAAGLSGVGDGKDSGSHRPVKLQTTQHSVSGLPRPAASALLTDTSHTTTATLASAKPTTDAAATGVSAVSSGTDVSVVGRGGGLFDDLSGDEEDIFATTELSYYLQIRCLSSHSRFAITWGTLKQDTSLCLLSSDLGGLLVPRLSAVY